MMLMTLCLGTQGALTLIFVRENLTAAGDPNAVVGILFSALGIGGLIGAVLTHRLIKKMSMLLLLFGSLAFDGAAVIVFAMSDTLALAITCFALFGIIGSVNQIVQDTMIQTIVPEHLRGRVYGAFGPITGPITLLSIGSGTSAASVIGTRAVFIICGVMEIGAAGICRILPMYQQVRRSLEEKMAEGTESQSTKQTQEVCP
jgi:MFS family permease